MDRDYPGRLLFDSHDAEALDDQLLSWVALQCARTPQAEALEDAAVLLASAGGTSEATSPVTSRSGKGWESLPAIEQRITTLVAQGRSNPDIAAELSLPRRTVQAHVTRVLGKLDARRVLRSTQAFQGGHGMYLIGKNKCANDTVTAYLTIGRRPATDLACEAESA